MRYLKTFTLLLLAGGLHFAANAQTNPSGMPAQPMPANGSTNAPAVQTQGNGVLSFDKTEYNFGSVTEGQVVEFEFKFKNTGTEPITISEVRPSCGCTAPAWTREPVAPGATGTVKASFNSSGKMGQQHKSITVMSNANNNGNGVVVLTFSGDVVARPAAPAQGGTTQPAQGGTPGH